MIKVKNAADIKAFGSHLRALRIQSGLTQEELANDCNISLSQIGRLERGEINTTIYTAYVLFKALKIEVADLFNYEFTE